MQKFSKENLLFWLNYQITDFTSLYMLNKSLWAKACDDDDDGLWL